MVRSDRTLHPEGPCDSPLFFGFIKPTRSLFLVSLLTFFRLQEYMVAWVRVDTRALRVRSTVGWFFPLPSLVSAAGTAAPAVALLVLVAAQAPLAARHGDARNDSTLATTRAVLEDVGTADGVRGLRSRGARLGLALLRERQW